MQTNAFCLLSTFRVCPKCFRTFRKLRRPVIKAKDSCWYLSSFRTNILLKTPSPSPPHSKVNFNRWFASSSRWKLEKRESRMSKNILSEREEKKIRMMYIHADFPKRSRMRDMKTVMPCQIEAFRHEKKKKPGKTHVETRRLVGARSNFLNRPR